MQHLKEYEDFKPLDYLYQFYSKENKENKFLLKFYIDSSFLLKKYWGKEKKDFIDLSGGPSLFSIIPFSSLAKTISFTDYLNINLDVIRFWLNKKEFFNWDPVIEAAIKIEKTIYETTTEQEAIFPKIIEERKESIRKKFHQILQIDLKSLYLPFQQYDLVLSNFVSECISTHTEEFFFVLQNILNYVKPNGFILFSFFLEANYLRIGNSHYPTYYLTYEFITRILEHYNLKTIKLERMNSIFHYGYKELLCILAQNLQNQNSIVISQEVPLIHIFNILLKKFKEKYINFIGVIDKKTLLKFLHFKIHYQFSHNFFNVIKYEDFKIFYDKYNIYIPFDSLTLIEEYLDILELDKNFYNLNLLKNKSFYFRRILKNQLDDFKEIKVYQDFAYITLVDLRNNDTLNELYSFLEEYFQQRYFIIKNIIYLPIYEFLNLKDIEYLKKIILFLKKENFLKDTNNNGLKKEIKIKLKKQNNILLHNNNNIVDFNFQRFNKDDLNDSSIIKNLHSVLLHF